MAITLPPRLRRVTERGTQTEAARRSPAVAHRALSLVAAVALIARMRAIWGETVADSPGLGALVISCYGILLVLAVLAIVARTGRSMARVDLALLGVGLAVFGAQAGAELAVGRSAYGTDVGALMQAAGQALANGGRLYGVSWPDALREFSAGAPPAPTVLLDGTTVGDFGYPPLGAALTAMLIPLMPGAPTAAVVAVAALVLATVLLFAILPAPLRPAAVLVCVGLEALPRYALAGYPAVMSLPLLLLGLNGFTSIGAGGRLRRRDVVRAACLGLAAATHQLAWFLLPFVLAAIWLLRRGELPARTTSRVVLVRFGGLVVASWVAVNAPFAAQGVGRWLRGTTEPLVQAAVPHGQGLVGLVQFSGDGTGRLQWFAFAAIAAGAGALAWFVLDIRRAGPAVFVLPWLLFFLAVRSQDGYYLLYTPIWLLGLATLIQPPQFVRAHRVRLPSSWPDWARAAMAATLPAVAVACAAVAVLTPPPLRLEVTDWRETPSGGIWQVEARVTNRTDRPLEPHFSVSRGSQTIPGVWSVISGPLRLGAGQVHRYTLVTTDGAVAAGAPRWLRATTASPGTVSSVRLPAQPTRLGTVLVGPSRLPAVAPGTPVRLRVQLTDGSGRDLARSGVPITVLARWVDGFGSVDDVLLINGRPPDAGRAVAVTDASGRAGFEVTSHAAQQVPIVLTVRDPPGSGDLTALWR